MRQPEGAAAIDLPNVPPALRCGLEAPFNEGQHLETRRSSQQRGSEPALLQAPPANPVPAQSAGYCCRMALGQRCSRCPCSVPDEQSSVCSLSGDGTLGCIALEAGPVNFHAAPEPTVSPGYASSAGSALCGAREGKLARRSRG